MSSFLSRAWSRSWGFRAALVLAAIYACARLAVQGIYLLGGLPGQPEEQVLPIDLQVYWDAGVHFRERQDIYLQGDLTSIEYHLPYPPSFAMAFSPLVLLPPRLVAVLHSLLHVGAYALLYVWWDRIFAHAGWEHARAQLAWTLPVWLVFGAFWSDLGYLNIYILLALQATLLIDAVLNERLGWALLWLSLILQTKPMWAFAAAVPLLLGRYRFFAKLAGGALAIYAGVLAATLLVAGPDYGWQQVTDYARLLPRLTRDFPWRGPDAPFLGYNHSIKQILIYWMGPSRATVAAATALKVVLLAPLGIISLGCLVRPGSEPGHRRPAVGLDLAFALYLGAFIWLDIVWEVSLGTAVLVYLTATLERRWTKVLAWVVFLPYALVDVWQIAGYAIFGMDVILPGPYVLTDPSIYVPLIMVVLVTFYALIVERLWGTAWAALPAGES